MHYTTQDIRVTAGGPGHNLRQHIREYVIGRVPDTAWCQVGRCLPLRYDTSIPSLVAEALPHCDGREYTDAVYVLECLHTRDHGQWAVNELGKTDPYWTDGVEDARRLIYVGFTVDLLARLDHHLNNAQGRGADFTRVFPPVRILDVSWYPSWKTAKRAEPIVAELLRERFPEDYISQPG